MSLQPLLTAIQRRHDTVTYPETYFGENVLNRLVYEHADLIADVLSAADKAVKWYDPLEQKMCIGNLQIALNALKVALKGDGND